MRLGGSFDRLMWSRLGGSVSWTRARPPFRRQRQLAAVVERKLRVRSVIQAPALRDVVRTGTGCTPDRRTATASAPREGASAGAATASASRSRPVRSRRSAGLRFYFGSADAAGLRLRVGGARTLGVAAYADAGPRARAAMGELDGLGGSPDEPVEFGARQPRLPAAHLDGSLRTDSESGVCGHRWCSAFVDGVDDFGVIDAAQVDRGHAEIGM